MQVATVEAGRIAWHTITAELTVGMLTLAFVSTVIRLLGAWMKQEQPFWRGLVRLAEPTAYLAGLGGLLAMIASIVLGFTYTWPLTVLLTSAVVLNKITLSVAATICWAGFVLMRSCFSAKLWEDSKLRRLYVALAAGGFLSLALIGSTGGHLAGKRSALDSVLHYFGINTHSLFVLSQTVNIALIALTGVVVILTLVQKRINYHRKPDTQPPNPTVAQ
jgi:hypothetical protein